MRKFFLAGVIALGAVIALSVVLLRPLPGPASQADAATVDPILFVHGYLDPGIMLDTMRSRFEADGWPSDRLYEMNYNTLQSNKTTANLIKDIVSEIRSKTGAAKVDIITHSMGGLSSRYYLKNLGGTSYVDDWVSLGGPNHGTTTALLCLLLGPSCWEMLPGSSFLKQLNSGDETPGAVNYGTWWSPCDEFINPDESVVLQGATNTKTACIGHLTLTQDTTVYTQVREFVR